MTAAAGKSLHRLSLIRVIGAAFLLLFLLSLILLLFRGRAFSPTGENTLGNPPGMVDRLVLLDSADLWRRGNLEGIEPSGEAASSVRLRREMGRQFPREGCWTSPVIASDFAFT